MGVYHSSEDFKTLQQTFDWLKEDSWIQYYRNRVEGNTGFEGVEDKEFKFEFGTMNSETTKTAHECLKILYEYQSLDKFLEEDPNPHIKDAQGQHEQEWNFLKFVFPTQNIEYTR